MPINIKIGKLMNNSKFFAAIDLGTNSCRLLIADENGKYVYSDTKATRLGEGMQAQMKFTDEAFERGINCFCDYGKKLKEYRVCECRAVATASCRMAKNAPEFIENVYNKSGIKIEVIDGLEEARLNLKGAISHVKGQSDYVVLYDLGGGSTEITLATNQEEPEILYTISIPWGARNAAEAYDLIEYDKTKALVLEDEIKNYVDGFVKDCNLYEYKNSLSFVATSSTPLRLVSMVKEFGEYDREGGDGLRVKCDEVNNQIAKIYSLKQSEMAKNPYIGERRSTIFVSACVIFKTIYDSLEAQEIVASLKSAKDGIVEELVEQNNKLRC